MLTGYVPVGYAATQVGDDTHLLCLLGRWLGRVGRFLSWHLILLK